MKLTINQQISLLKDFKPNKIQFLKGAEQKGIYKMDLGDDKLYFIALKRKSYEGVNFKDLIYGDELLFKRLMKLKCSGSYFKKVLFVVGKNFHWLSL